jgi:two-component system NtrC family sensor kinase
MKAAINHYCQKANILKTVLVFGSISLFTGAYPFLFPQMGTHFGILAAIPVVLSGFLFGLNWAVSMAIIMFFMNLGLLNIQVGSSSIFSLDVGVVMGSIASLFVGAVIGRLRDLKSKLTLSHDYIEKIIQSISDAILVISTTGEISRVNENWTALSGYSEIDSSELNVTDLIFKDGSKPFFSQDILNRFANGETLKESECLLAAKCGKTIDCLISASVLNRSDRKRPDVVIVIRDRTLSVLYEELQEKKDQLIQSEKLAALGEMTAGIAHEINNPLFLIQGFNQRLKSVLEKTYKPVYQEVAPLISQVDDGSKRIERIISQISDFCRPSGKSFKSVDLKKVVNRSFFFLESELSQTNILVDKQFSEASCEIQGNGNRLEQVFLNLLSNAKDALLDLDPATERKLGVSIIRQEKDVLIQFTNNGPCIEQESLSKIFDPFFSTKEVGKGTGLGLSVSYGIVQEHQGKISCSSDQETGTTFSIVLPV